MLASIPSECNSKSRVDRFTSRLLESGPMTIGLEDFKRRRRERMALLVKAVGQTRLSALTGISAGYLYQISTATGTAARPVNDATVRKLEAQLKHLPRGWLDSDEPLPDLHLDDAPALPNGWSEAREANNLEAVRLALGAICTVLAATRPTEGEQLAAMLRRAPKKYLDKEGLLTGLVEAAESAARQARARHASQPAAKPPSGKRTGPSR